MVIIACLGEPKRPSLTSLHDVAPSPKPFRMLDIYANVP